jgi:hypothetical protein
MKKQTEKKPIQKKSQTGLLIKSSLLSLSAYFSSYLAALDVVTPRN